MPKLTITFDNGPTPGITDHVLDVLAEFNVKATFFLVGNKLLAPGARELAIRAKYDGHWIGNHTLSHGVPLGLQCEVGSAIDEIKGMEALLKDLAHDDHLFRPNGRGKLGAHLLSQEAIEYIVDSGATVVLWTSVPLDRKVDVPTPQTWLAEAKRDVLDNDWTLMVLHDRPSGHEGAQPMDYLADLLKWANENDIEIVQDFPPSCVPIRCGEIMMPLSDISS
ncbi:putative polysaccharide deacetylase PdaA precursor [Pseudomonas sp. 37 R 15]|uniref:polysaccharide deacetylase family protein n=1 Tax=Pseudomonas sp. 37 R 15 TaxID=1844104 RepID=UPI0008125CFB|nr:polysaccharide deacetylase family protein [Pseudomonas sp. 37 R 15]CRM38192.1 putative polysaccharide deacetylase PdaA precursor [Pseudomonas sp. 37 R 15]